MSDNSWRRVSYLFGLLPIGALFGVVVYVANLEIKDLDLWLHLAVGRYISLNHVIPAQDILSCSIAGKPWINHEWLFQLIVYQIFQHWGPDGLIKMQVVIVILTMLFLLFLGYNKEKQLSTVFGLVLVYLIYQQRFTIRPDIYSLLFFVFYIFVLALHIDKKWAPFALFIVQILWANIHGFFFFGPLFVLIGLISEWIKRRVQLPYEWNASGRLTDSEYQRLKVTLLLVILACVFNPYTLEGALYPLGVFFSLTGENKIFFKHIQELQKPVTWATLGDIGQSGFYKLFIIVSFLSFIFNRRRIDMSALLFWLVFLIFSLNAARNTAFFAFAAYLVFITNTLSISSRDIIPLRFTEQKFQHITSAAVKFLILMWIFQYGRLISAKGYYDFDQYKHKSEFGGISLRGYPDKAADFLVKNKIKGNFFNDFNSGAYLLGRTFPDIKVFIDGRTEVYGGEFFKEYQKIWDKGDLDLLEQAVEKYELSGALLNSVQQHIPKEILRYFYAHKEWILVYFDYDGLIFLRDIPANKEWIERFAIEIAQWQPPAIDLLKLGATYVLPYRYYHRAYTLESLDLDDLAMQEAQEAVKITPGYAEAYELMGKIYAKRKEYRRAFEHFRIAVMGLPNHRSMRDNLALSLLDMGAYEAAIEQYQQITGKWPNDPKAFFFLAKAYAKAKKYEDSFKSVQRAHRLDPGDVMDILKIGDMMYEQEEYVMARRVYAIALETKKDLATVHKKIGLSYKNSGEPLPAREALKKALAMAPDDEELKNELTQLGGY